MEQKIEKGIGFLQKLIALQNKYGFFSIIKGLFILLLSGYVVFFALNPTYLLEKIENTRTEQHEDAIAKRIKSDTEIRLILERLLNKSEAGRSWLIEFHNGNSNLGSGLPFLFGSMRLETTKDGVFSLWNGHRPVAVRPRRRSWTYWPMTSSMSLRRTTSCIYSWGIMGWAAPPFLKIIDIK
mgnify:CR=1 FL=1